MSDAETVVRDLQPRLWRLGMALGADSSTAEDLAQQVLIRLLTGRRIVLRTADPWPYARRSLINAYVSHWRKQNRESPYGLSVEREAEGSLEDVVVQRAQISTLLSRLPPRQRALIVLRFYEGLTDPEIAQVMRKPRSSVSSDLTRALQTMRNANQQSEDEAVVDRG